jgi:hypothetical protein
MRDDLEFAVLAYLAATDLMNKPVAGFESNHPAWRMTVDTNYETWKKALAGLKKCVREGPECELTFPVLTYLKLLDAGTHRYDPDRPSDHGPARVDEVNAARRKAELALRDMVGANR